MRISLIPSPPKESCFFTVSPVESWQNTSNDFDGKWFFAAEIETGRLLPDVEQRFLSALARIGVFPHFKAYDEDYHVVSINEWIYGAQQDAIYELAEDFGLNIISE